MQSYFTCMFLHSRFLIGFADAAIWGSSISILMEIFPNRASTVVAWSELLSGLGLMLGIDSVKRRVSIVF